MLAHKSTRLLLRRLAPIHLDLRWIAGHFRIHSGGGIGVVKKKHYLVLDGMRGVAAITVMVFHICQINGYVAPRFASLAVDFFFVLSGWVVAHAYEERLLSGMSFGHFAALRLARLYPMILLGTGIGLTITFGRYVLVHDLTPYQVAWEAGTSLLALPCFALPQYPTAFPANMAIWSLFFEIIANMIYAAGIRMFTNSAVVLTIAISAIALICLWWMHGTMQVGMDKHLIAGGLARVGYSFFVGVIMFRWLKVATTQKANSPAAIALLTLLAFILVPVVNLASWADLVLVLAIFPVIVAIGAKIEPGPRISRICAWLASLSYPLYAIHAPILRGVSTIRDRVHALQHHVPMLMVAEAILAAVCAMISLRFYDEPVRIWLSRRIKATWPSQPAGVIGDDPAASARA